MAEGKASGGTKPKPSIDLSRSIGPNLRRWRKKRGYSQERLGDLADIHRTTVGLVERGEREPGADIIAKLSGALRISPNALFEGLEFVPAEVGHGRYSYEIPAPENQERPGPSTPGG